MARAFKEGDLGYLELRRCQPVERRKYVRVAHRVSPYHDDFWLLFCDCATLTAISSAIGGINRFISTCSLKAPSGMAEGHFRWGNGRNCDLIEETLPRASPAGPMRPEPTVKQRAWLWNRGLLLEITCVAWFSQGSPVLKNNASPQVTLGETSPCG